jgi:hypothetical protein
MVVAFMLYGLPRDSVSAFHYMKKPGSGGAVGNLPSSIEGSHVFYSQLANLLRRCGVPVVATVQALFKPKNKPANNVPGVGNEDVNKRDRGGEGWQNFTGPGWRDQLAQSFLFEKICDSGVFRVFSRNGAVPPKKWRMNLAVCTLVDNDGDP